MYYKLLNRINATDYKKLDIEQISSVYTNADSTMAIVNTTEEVAITNDEITKIEETEFTTLKDSWENERKSLVTTLPQLTKEELLEKQLLETQATLANLQEQILKSNGGM